MKKIALSLILACGVAMAADVNATDANKTDANKTDANATAAAPAAAGNGKALFGKCAGCHGANGATKALGKSDVIKGWDAAKVEEALKGYKAGTRNAHGMGGVMKGQAAALSDDDIKALASYISSLK